MYAISAALLGLFAMHNPHAHNHPRRNLPGDPRPHPDRDIHDHHDRHEHNDLGLGLGVDLDGDKDRDPDHDGHVHNRLDDDGPRHHDGSLRGARLPHARLHGHGLQDLLRARVHHHRRGDEVVRVPGRAGDDDDGLPLRQGRLVQQDRVQDRVRYQDGGVLANPEIA
ncbi:uncharacterized protein E0L32_002875 [Thyridium curvatum]|uniref:Uncharacterized protein n=1 Tax=Thyridium curvatum TaxID=1093900 RepID=A0A507BG79_9PEZI|nr:uncharacterized protein E0L32_002875 [Thyridium curvatum]TPX17774.1 hypothetical protein E0L32_002875 [Thyridium curvatum]